MTSPGAGFATPQVARGLEGVVAAATQIAEVNGELGRLTFRGYDIRELAGRTTFEEVAYLLWHGKLPNRAEYDALRAEMSAARELPDPALTALRVLSPHATGMDILRMGASMLSIGDADLNNPDIASNQRRAARLQAQMPALVAKSWRLHNGREIVPPKPEHGLAQGFLYMLEGREPEPYRVDLLNAYLVAISEHGLNASTFTGRCVISTGSDMVSALTAAIAALKGPRHGGVPGPVLDMLEAYLPAPRGKAVLHWFTGTKAEARRALDLGCYFSINSKMLENDRHLATVASLPIERLLTETDGPFVEIAKRPVRPSDVEATVAALARLHKAETDSISAAIGSNLKSLLSE